MHKFLRRGAAFGAALALTAAIPAAARAATLTNAGGTLTYAGGAPGALVHLHQLDPNVATVTVTADGTADPITATGCTGVGPYTCAGVNLVVADGGGGNDTLDSGSTVNGNALQMVAHLSGGPGDDGIYGGVGADILNGGPGDDNFEGAAGVDQYSGGTGIDSIAYFSSLAPPATAPATFSVTLDGVANDGLASEIENVPTDIENVNAGSVFTPTTGPDVFGAVTLTGDAAANELSAEGGDNTVTGGGGNDTLSGGLGNDTFNARDGYADRVSCGSGTDTAIVDTLDIVSAACENVSTADVGNATEDKPPTVAWTSPAASAKFAGSKVTTLAVTATDDKAVSKVVFMDDDRVACTDTVAPYTCAYQARAADIGRNTLTAVASDALGQTASSVRPVVVTRFSVKSVSLKVSRAGSVATASGKITLPTSVSKSQGCNGTTVTVKPKSGSSRSARVSRSCTYSLRFTSARKGQKFKASFSGNDVVSARSSRTVSAR